MTNAIIVKNLKKNYGELKAVDGVNLQIKEGEFFALLGPNGAGKSTTIHVLTSLAVKSSGTVKIFNHDIETDHIKAREQIGLVPQEFNMDIFEIVEKLLYFNAGYYGIPRAERKKRIEEVLELTGLTKKRKVKVIALSGGMKRKLMIARALLHKPKILILDEPTAGVDVETRQDMWKFLKKLNKESKMTFLLTTHYIEEAEQLCERIAIIQKGKIIACDNKDKIMKKFGRDEVHVTLSKNVSEKEVASVLKGYNYENGGKLVKITIPAENFDYNKLVAKLGKLPLDKIITKEKSLEEIFVDLTHKYQSKKSVGGFSQ